MKNCQGTFLQKYCSQRIFAPAYNYPAPSTFFDTKIYEAKNVLEGTKNWKKRENSKQYKASKVVFILYRDMRRRWPKFWMRRKHNIQQPRCLVTKHKRAGAVLIPKILRCNSSNSKFEYRAITHFTVDNGLLLHVKWSRSFQFIRRCYADDQYKDMSSPQRQVGSRRLPPLPKAIPSGFVKVGKNESTGAKATFSAPGGLNGKLPLELSSDLMEGPFRPSLTPDTFAQFLPSAKTQEDGAQHAGKDGLIPGLYHAVYFDFQLFTFLIRMQLVLMTRLTTLCPILHWFQKMTRLHYCLLRKKTYPSRL